MVTMKLCASNFGVSAHSSRTFVKKSPLTNTELCKVVMPEETSIRETIDEMVLKVNWIEEYGILKRSKIIYRVADELLIHKEQLANLVRWETGKPIKMARDEVEVGASFLRSIAGLSVFKTGNVIPSQNDAKFVWTERVPYGLALLIMSFNTPIPNYCWKFGPAWLSGNSVVLKPSEHTPLSSTLFAEICLKAGVPEDSFCLIQGDKSVGEFLVQLNFDLVSFTGSLSTGQRIQEKTSKLMRKTIFELGGDNALVVCQDANLDDAVDATIESAFSNSGQRCAAASRLLLHSDVYEEFITKLKEKTQRLKIGIDDDATIGPIIDEIAFGKYQEFIDKCRQDDTLITQLGDVEKGNLLARPTIVFCKDVNMWQQELFLPILRVSVFNDDDEAIAMSNDSLYGLTAAVWTQDLSRIYKYSRSLQVGVLNFNGPTHGAEFQFPFGGTKGSGNGTKEVGMNCLDEYSFLKLHSITFHTRR